MTVESVDALPTIQIAAGSRIFCTELTRAAKAGQKISVTSTISPTKP
jgi:hypothetical protein